ncbi:MAG: histidine--tRNA ligase [Fervidobacterium sp.]|uniref:Histidine--tRNA ligase n=1 Tax=Fervidobacterium pennivorans TaxID=93466 RepID=A0A172T482_FERPE|nr:MULTISPECIES: histidine--tRNA ligase [Fervidobacterium]ANE41653.1 histidyl-tRNA synthetase [Fervidobacterium pennivorans]NPU89443.1 histidine--tRNA ligase [Fervidobacterium sp.]
MYQKIKGTEDLYGQEMKYWYWIEEKARKISLVYGFTEIRTPIFEETKLFVRSVGQDTDIVQKEMYTFEDKGGRSITLRPEGTAPVVRAFVENGLITQGFPQKYFYIGPMFRYERPQSGRQRQFHQFGAEIFGSPSALADAELIAFVDRFLRDIGLVDFEIHINTLGDAEDRANYKQALREYYAQHLDHLCDDCKVRYERNPLRLLDCKVDVEYAKQAPKLIDYIGENARKHYEELKKLLNGLGIKYVEDPRLVRGLDYYNRTVFEVHHHKLGAMSAIAGGGRYDNLIKEIGGKDVPALGFAAGMERLILALKAENVHVDDIKINEVYIAHFGGEEVKIEAMKLAQQLRREGIAVNLEIMERGLSAQLKNAARTDAKLCIIIGENELERDIVLVKNMETGEQLEFEKNFVVTGIKDLLTELA